MNQIQSWIFGIFQINGMDFLVLFLLNDGGSFFSVITKY